jgi:hypothetical protein
MRRTLIILAVITIIVTVLAYLGEDAYAGGFTRWTPVTWNNHYEVVRHRNVHTGTVCQAVRSNGTFEQFKLVSKNVGNHACVPGGGQG